MELLGAIIALSTIHPFQTGKVAHHDKLDYVTRVSYGQSKGTESSYMTWWSTVACNSYIKLRERSIAAGTYSL